MGYKETSRFGAGFDAQFELEERIPLVHTRNLRVGLNDHAEGEFLLPMNTDDSDPRYDINHQLDLNVDLWPGQRVQLGNTFRLLNHLGTDLEFSEDTLRNALTHNIQLKYIQRRLRASLDHLTISDFGDDGDLRLHLNSRLTYRLSQGTSVNMVSMYRYQSDLYADYLWLNTFLKIDMRYFDCALELRTQGDPEQIFDENFSLYVRFMRQVRNRQSMVRVVIVRETTVSIPV